jgi:hypothetical protein
MHDEHDTDDTSAIDVATAISLPYQRAFIAIDPLHFENTLHLHIAATVIITSLQ